MNLLSKDDRIYIAGHRGLVGSAIQRNLESKGYKNFILKTHQELDLIHQESVYDFFKKEKPQVVFLAAARVGGIVANNKYRADFLHENLSIQNNIIWSAHETKVRRLIFLGSSCIYPREAPQPMVETCLLTGPLEYTNRAYALAKIAGLEQVETLRKQYNLDYFSVMPTNLYGPGDNFDPERSHVLPALIRKFTEAKEKNLPEVILMGTGKPLRELMYVEDCADAIVYVAQNLTQEKINNAPIGKAGWSHINVGSGHEFSIKDLGTLVAKLTNFKGEIKFDSTKPDGTPRKLMDSTFLNSLGWRGTTSLEKGIEKTIQWYNKNRNSST